MTDTIGPKLKVASVFIFLRFIMTLGMTATTVVVILVGSVGILKRETMGSN